ncbi:hypothetical protein [Candidatus Clostridium helianthi]|uniref:DUF4351 domain-containing protein n=1 Tax=Candidatus Clostridium helianthi TaxID=3381660 RepID=A0ABW8S125_9CLOT
MSKGKKTKNDIANQLEDAVMKEAFDFFKEGALSFFGINKKIIGTPKIEQKKVSVKTTIPDYVFLLNDDTLIHFEFQTTSKKEDIYRFHYYDAKLSYDYLKPVNTIVVYTAKIKNSNTEIDLGSSKYKVSAYYLSKINGDERLEVIEEKINNGIKLTKEDLINIVFCPLMDTKYKGSEPYIRAINIAESIKDEDDKREVLTLFYALTLKYVQEKYKNKVLEVFGMTKVGKDLINIGETKGKIETKRESTLELLQEKFNLSLDTINDIKNKLVNITDFETLSNLFKEAIRCDSIDSFIKKIK